MIDRFSEEPINLDVAQRLLLAVGRIEGRQEDIHQRLEDSIHQHEGCEERLRHVETTLHLHKVIGGAMAAGILAWLVDFSKKHFIF